MWSKFVSFVDDLNNEEEDDYSDSSTEKTGKLIQGNNNDLPLIQQELNKYKDKVIKLREELRDAEANAQESNHEFSKMIKDKEDENTQLKKQIEKMKQEHNKVSNDPVISQRDVDQLVNERTSTLQQRIKSLEDEVNSKNQQLEHVIDKNNKETEALKEKLLRVETNVHNTPVAESTSSNISSESLTWLNTLRMTLDHADEPSSLDVPPSSDNSELYICLDGLYTAMNEYKMKYQSNQDNMIVVHNQYDELYKSVINLVTIVDKDVNEDIPLDVSDVVVDDVVVVVDVGVGVGVDVVGDVVGDVVDGDVVVGDVVGDVVDGDVNLLQHITSLSTYITSLQSTEQQYEQYKLSSSQQVEQLQTQVDSLQKEKEHLINNISTSERRYESLKSEMRELMRKEQEYEDHIDILMKENKNYEMKIVEFKQKNEEIENTNVEKAEIKKKMLNEIKKKENEIESLSIQLATFKTENDELLKERLEKRKDYELIDELKSTIQSKEQMINVLQTSISDLTQQCSTLQESHTQLSIQYKNAQDDLNFAQLCVKNLQAALSVYSKTEPEQKPEQKPEPEQKGKKEVKENEDKIANQEEDESKPSKEIICPNCIKKQEEINSLQSHMSVMDTELIKLRKVAKDEQTKVAKQQEEYSLQIRTFRQLLITYLTSVRGGTALRALMENLKLSEEEQRVCVLKEVEKYNEHQSDSGGLLSWIGGIGVRDMPDDVVHVNSNASVDELWKRLLQYEQSK